MSSTVKPVLSGQSKRRPSISFQDRLSLNAGQKYCRMLQGEHSAIRSTFIKLPLAIKTFVFFFLSGCLRQVLLYRLQPMCELKQSISDDGVALQCDLCDNWYCASCMKIEKCIYESMNKCKESQGIVWFCSNCRISLSSTQKLVEQIGDVQGQD